MARLSDNRSHTPVCGKASEENAVRVAPGAAGEGRKTALPNYFMINDHTSEFDKVYCRVVNIENRYRYRYYRRYF